MKRWATLTLLLLPMACAIDPSGGSDPDEAVGSTEQAATTFLPNGYGFMAGLNRCWIDPGNGITRWQGDCNIPRSKRITIAKHPSTCSGPFASNYAAAMNNAVTIIRDAVNGRGWSVSESGAIGGAINIDLSCGAAFGSGGDQYCQSLFVSSFGPANDCRSTSAGRLCGIDSARTRCVQASIETATFVAASSLAKTTFLTAQFAHQAGHAIGLGHDLCGGEPLADLMGKDACSNVNNVSSYFGHNFNPFELTLLSQYRPG